jgi:hypothetical protein
LHNFSVHFKHIDITSFQSTRMMDAIQMAIPDVELRCFDLGSMSMQQQVLMVEKASVHVSPQGGLSYLSLFAQEGASLVLLVMLRRLSCAPTLCNQT